MSSAARVIPLMNRILVKKAEPVLKTKRGVIIPDLKKNQPCKATVVAVGPGVINESGNHVPCCLNVGDSVLLPDWGGTKVQYDDRESHQEYVLYRESDILAKVDE